MLRHLVPEPGLTRFLYGQSILSAAATGAFLTGSAVFFTQIVGLSAAQVGLGMSIGGLASFALAVPTGLLADRIGWRETWLSTAAVEAVLFLTWPWLEGFWQFVAMQVAFAVVDTLARSGRAAYTLTVFPPGDRVRSLAFIRSARNIGYTLGALLGGIALATGSDRVVQLVPLLTGAMLVLNALLLLRLPPVARPARAATPERRASGGLARANPGFAVLGVCNGVMQTNQILLNVIVPLWLVQETDAPRVLLAWLFATNTVLAVLLQVPAARGSETVAGSLRAFRLSAGCFVLSAVLIAVTADTVSWATIVLIWVGHVTITGAELWSSAGNWGFTAELSEASRRGEYQGLWALGDNLVHVIGPALFTWLAMEHGWVGWTVIAALGVLAAVIAHPAARAAEGYLERRSGAVPA